jgi:YD repeat-containing protein
VTVNIVDAGPRKVSRSVVVKRPASELFELVANPHLHAELDGSGTVVGKVKGPDRLSQDGTFSVAMKAYGAPYRITSRVSAFADDRLIEWKHPMGHRWRWEFSPQADGSTLVTETFDYSRAGALKAKIYSMMGLPRQNAAGIEKTLDKLSAR